MQIAAAIKAFESRFSVIQETTVYQDDLAEVVSGGVKEEGGSSLCLCLDESTAIRLWYEAACAYAAGKGNVLVWRIKPDVDGWTFYHHDYAASPDDAMTPLTLYKARSRFAVRKGESKPSDASVLKIAGH